MLPLHIPLLAALLLATPPAERAPGPGGTTDEPDPSPSQERRWDEQVEVEVVLGEAPAGPLGASSTVLDPDPGADTPSALTDLVAAVPGISQNGQAGLFQVFSIRGVSRQRVRSLVSGVRITSERRAGVSTSFLDPALMGSVEVLRGPATTFQGSGALGGVVEVIPRQFGAWSFGAGYDTDGDESYLLVGTGADAWSVGVARRHAGDGESADGTRLNSHFTQYSAVLRGGWERGSRRYELLAIPARGEDIGKANTDFPSRTTDYPVERHGLVKLSVESRRGWRAHAFIHAHDLETRVVEPGVERVDVFNDTFDLGLRWEQRRKTGPRLALRYGVDGFGRRDVDAEEVQQDLAGTGADQTLRTLDGAEETELGGYGALRWSGDRTSWEIGTRFSWQGQENAGGANRDHTAWNAFAGVVRSVGEHLELRGSISSGLRFPALGELFFTGTTGRGGVVGNPQLGEERSLNAEVSARWVGSRLVLGTLVFRNRIEDYIERVEFMPDLLTFVNLTSGAIAGLELQGVARAAEHWSLSWGGHLIDGRDSAGGPLADTPPDELYVGAVHRLGGWRTETRLALRNRRGDPGSGEKAIPSAELLDAAVRYRWAGGWEVGISATNLLDEPYFASADRKAPLAPGRAFSLHVSRRGG